MAENATQYDFLGEGGVAATPSAPAGDPAELERLREARRRAQISGAGAATANINLQNQPGQQFAPTDAYFTEKNRLAAAAAAGAKPQAPGATLNNFLNESARTVQQHPWLPLLPLAPLAMASLAPAAAGTGSIAAAPGEAAVYTGAAAAPAVTAPATIASPFAAGAAPAAAAGGVTAGQVLSGVGAAGTIGGMIAGGFTGAPKVNAPQVGAGFATQGGGGGGGGGGGAELGAPQSLDQISALRDRTAQDMFSYGDSAQSRTAPQTNAVSYKPAQTVTAPKLAPAAQAQVGDYGAPQTINAQRATIGNYGGPQTINAQQASATQAQNQAGFLSGTAQSARNVADLDFSQSNESRGAQQANLSRIGGFLDSGPGPSMAQQQLRQAQEQNLGDALALARSGRGNASGNMKMALSENAATNAETNRQAALLRAQEADMWQQRQLQGMGLEQSGANAMRGLDLGAAQAQGQQALSREQLAANVDVSRAGLEQGLSQFNAGQANQIAMGNAELGTNAAIQQAGLANALNIAQGNAGTQVNMGNAELGTNAAIQQAGLNNALNIARGNAGTQVNLGNAEQTNLTNRLQGQMGLDAATTTAGLRNAVNIAQGNSDTSIAQSNLQAQLDQSRANDAFTNAMYGYGMDAYGQQFDAARAGLDDSFRYRDLAAEIAMRDADRAAGIATGNADRTQRRDAALIGGGAAVLENLDDLYKAFK